MIQSELKIWWQGQQFNFPEENRKILNCAIDIAESVSLDLKVDQQNTSKKHVIELVKVLVNLRADDEVIIAALLFHVCRSGPQITQVQRQLFSSQSLFILDEIYKVSQQKWMNDTQALINNGELLRRLLFAMIKDVRLVLILLADQLVLLKAAVAFPQKEQQKLAQLTQTLHAPLANRLGVWQVKWELEDYSFRFSQPKEYKEIANLLAERRIVREEFIAYSIEQLTHKLKEVNINADIVGRPKHIYSIFKKMQKKNLTFNALYDIRAIRVLVDDLSDCYAVLGMVHALWKHIPKEFDDYIAMPKGNNYQSLHTVVIGEGGKTLEVQIRTHQMHEHAELGVAAHWRYKDESRQDTGYDNKVNWMRQLLAVNEAEGDSQYLLDQFETETVEERIYVFTPAGDVIDLSAGSTVVDFAYHVHTEVGHRTRGAKVNGSIVPLTTVLGTGDRIEILTAKVAKPSRDWLSEQAGYLNSAKAKAKVRHWFRENDFEQNVIVGKEALDKELKKFALESVNLKQFLPKYNLKEVDKLYARVATGDVSVNQILRLAEEQLRPQKPRPFKLTKPVPSQQNSQSNPFKIEGLVNVMVTQASCCHPVLGDSIGGFITRTKGVSVHGIDCDNLIHMMAEEPERIIAVAWSNDTSISFPVEIEITAYDRKSFIKDLSSVLAHLKANIEALIAQSDKDHGINHLKLTIRVNDFEHLNLVLSRISTIEYLISVKRTS
ncbi:MAG: bifunctional (p)ppGpp synthetase/guanosine-3',5'-bis(diphosphate) 3'-pyrophosphohydrolase [Alcanivoracaceae bacterium]|nr:bifunctional (p)ppGpp synthetase/guanosine-3',5'-bis(diphosphate) 3'-pyrophosphohydrolase [Alcanivoracaceae bacterium]